ncbi:tRNA nucleotidyltransferase (CCA-adding enzyme) [Desulfitispora alkaliphila]|uniref:CCA tRNA nucleotidyltransferase n=1 Tax=Desulfitispora alkaliphila TaxID=622674 RepID=UPI003D1A4CB0
MKILNFLKENKIPYFIVGGYVRDHILGRESNDIDIIVNESLERVYSLIKAKKHFVKGELIRLPEHKVEISKLDTTIEADLIKRDFTINAMAMAEDGSIIDPTGGRRDCQDRVIRIISEENLIADYCRAIKGIRHSAELEFSLESYTLELFKTHKALIRTIPKERIALELNKMLLLPKPSLAFEELRTTGILQEIIPALDELYGLDQNNPHHSYDIYWHTLSAIDNADITDLSEKDALILRLAALGHDWGKPEVQTINPKTGFNRYIGHADASARIFKKYLKTLKYGKNLIDQVTVLVAKHMKRVDLLQMRDHKVREFLFNLREVNLELLFRLFVADELAKGREVDEAQINHNINLIKERFSKLKPEDLAITGHDIVNNSSFRGSNVGEVKEKLQKQIFKKPELNEKSTLLKMLKDLDK